MRSELHYDAVVIGAGIVGAACAEALSAAGLRVVIVERGVIGGGATAAAMGHIVVMDGSEAEMARALQMRVLSGYVHTPGCATRGPSLSVDRF